MNKKTIIAVAVALFLGMGLGNSMKAPEPVVKEVVKEVPVEKVVEKNADEWKQLKSIDDQGFVVAGETLQLCSAGYYAIANGDTGTLTAVADKTKKNTVTLNDLAAKRQDVLKKLGY